MSISPERKRRGTRLNIGPNYLDYSFEINKETKEESVYLDNLYSINPGSGKELIRKLIKEVGKGVPVTTDVIESETRKRLIKEGLFSQLICQNPGSSLAVDEKLWPKLKMVRVFEGGGLTVQEVVLERLEDDIGKMLDGWDIAVRIKAVT